MRGATYEIVRLLGEGGMGRVYEAVHRPTGRRVALKRVRTSVLDAATRRAFLDEATAAAQLVHRNVVRLFDVELDEGRPMLVMELVDSTDLRPWTRAWPGWIAVRGALLQTLEALSEAHAKRIVHGDLKPANLLCASDGTVKVADFGVAHVLDPSRTAARRGPAGTPVYMAPEQFESSGLVGPWTDLYALGVVLAELLCGREPFTGQTLAQLLVAKTDSAPELVPRVGLEPSPALLELLRELLAPDPRKRPRFARAVQERLASAPCFVGERDLAATLADLPSAPTLFADDATQLDAPTSASRAGSFPHLSDSSTQDLRTTLPARSPAGPGASATRLRAAPLVGRAAEVAEIRRAIASVAAGECAAFLVTGPPGVGKSFLARHLFEQVEREGLMESAAVVYETTGASVLGGLRAGLRRLLGTPSPLRAGDPTSWAWLDDGRVDVRAIARWLGPDAPALPVDRSVALAHSLLRAAGRVRPVYLWMDELGAARDGAGLLIERLLAANDARVLVVATAAEGSTPLPRHPRLVTIALGPLSPSDRADLFRAFGLSPGLADAVARGTSDPPAAVGPRVNAWLAAGLLARRADGWDTAPGVDLAALLDDRWRSADAARVAAVLDDLGDAAARGLACAALLGVRFDAETLRLAVGHEALDAALDRALVEGLLRAEGQRTYAFDHAALHEQVLAWALALDRVNELRVATARALLTAHANGHPPALERAASLLHEAGDAAAMDTLRQAVHAYAHAADYAAMDRLVTMAREWLEASGATTDDPEWASFEHVQGLAAYHQLDYARARAHLRRAVDLARRGGDALAAAEAATVLVSVDFYDGRLADAERSARERVSLHGEGPRWQRLRTTARHTLAQIAAYRGDLAATEAELRACADTAPPEDAWGVAMRAELAEVMALRGEGEQAAAIVAAAAEASARCGTTALEKELALCALRVDTIRGRYGAARPVALELAGFFEAQGDKWRATATLAFCAVLSAIADDLPLAREAVRTFLAAYRAVPHDEATTWWAMDKTAAVLRERGEDVLADEVDAVVAAARAAMLRALSPSGE
jgi:serine/threonine protein kinase